MFSGSNSSLTGNPQEQPPVSVFNPSGQYVPHIQLMQAVPVHPLYTQTVPVVLNPARVPVTLLPQHVTVRHQPSTAEGKLHHPYTNCRIALVVMSHEI